MIHVRTRSRAATSEGSGTIWRWRFAHSSVTTPSFSATGIIGRPQRSHSRVPSGRRSLKSLPISLRPMHSAVPSHTLVVTAALSGCGAFSPRAKGPRQAHGKGELSPNATVRAHVSLPSHHRRRASWRGERAYTYDQR